MALRRTRALTASAANLRIEGARGAATTARQPTDWQRRSMAFYDTLGEIWYAAQVYARMISRVELYVGRRLEDGSVERVGQAYTEEDDAGQTIDVQPSEEDVQIADTLTRIRDPRGGRAQLLATYGQLRFLTGECYLVCTFGEGDSETWEVLSVEELRPRGDGVYDRHFSDGGQRAELHEPELGATPQPGEVVVYRLWNPHPRFSVQADCAMKGCLDVCEELLLLTLAVRAKARSRAAGPGLLYVPIELDLPDPKPGDGSGATDATGKFMRDLQVALTTPLSDEGSASSVVPMIVRGPAELGKGLIRIQVAENSEVYPEAPKIDQAIQRIALSLDMPPERLLGTGDVNHWGAWQVDEDTWKTHGQPVTEQLCDELTVSFLWPELVDANLTETPDEYLVWYDASNVVSHPDRGRAASDGHDRLTLSDGAWREANGFDQSDAPSENERATRVAERAAMRTRGETTGQAQDAATGEPSTSGEPSSSDTTKEPPAPAALLEGAMAMAIQRAREAAGARLRQKLRRSTELTLLMGAVPNDRLASELGFERVAELQNGDGPVDVAKLCAGASEPLRAVLEHYGVAPADARLVASLTLRYAQETLWRAQAPMPAALRALAERYGERR